jgi:hypothetical protein
MDFTDPTSANFRDFRAEAAAQSQNPFKLDETNFAQFAVYMQDEFVASDRLNITAGIRLDIPIYLTDLDANPFVNDKLFLNENFNNERVDISAFPDALPPWSPRIGFNYAVNEDRSTQLRGGTGVFTGRLPFVWLGNQTANQGPEAKFSSFDMNGTASDFKWPQAWKTNIALDHQLPFGILGTAEFIYGKDLNNIIVRNANLAAPVGKIGGADGRLRWDPSANRVHNLGGGDLYILDNTDDGYSTSITAQLRKNFTNGLSTQIGYNYLEAKNNHSSTEIASFLWQFNPIQNNPNDPAESFSQFGHRHRIAAGATYSKTWSNSLATHFGMFFTTAEGNRFSYVVAGDLNGDGVGGNDLLYVPRDASEIAFQDINGGLTAAQQWTAFNAFIEQDDYLSENRGKISERNGATNPWFSNLDIRVMQDFALNMGGRQHRFQLSLDMLNVGNMINSDWGVQQIAGAQAKAPLLLTGFNSNNEPIYQFTGAVTETFVNDFSLNSRWQAQLGLKYIFE